MDIRTALHTALLIRKVEERLLDLFNRRNIHGTIHTCIGQELAATAVCGTLSADDFVCSNHRCHGHYLAFTGDVAGLMAEVTGKRSGICAGIGGSMNLHRKHFLSNGIIGGMIGIAAGIGLAHKLDKSGSIAVCFIGDGAMGQGVVYEVMNMVSLMQIPLLIVCENNAYSYDTPHHSNTAGDIVLRAQSFDIKTFESDIWDIDNLLATARESVQYVRSTGMPAFALIDSYRLLSHSTHCNDYRDREEILTYALKDPLHIFSQADPDTYRQMEREITAQIDTVLESIRDDAELSIDDYYSEPAEQFSSEWVALEPVDTRQVKLINEFFHETMARDRRVVFMGEDVLSPFGGAFKVAAGLSDAYPDRIISTPISEQAMTGMSVGLALKGYRPFVEIMFCDFLTLCMDQLLNHAGKMFSMYNRQLSCPLVIRTPSGGGSGMGATHSQSLEKMVAAVDGVTTIALNNLIDPKEIYSAILNHAAGPVVVLENKRDYGKKIAGRLMKRFICEKSAAPYPTVRIRPTHAEAGATIVTYGGMVDTVLDAVKPLFLELELFPEIFVLSCVRPIAYADIVESVRKTGKLYVVEEGSAFGGIGSEVIATVTERAGRRFTARRIAALPVALPAVQSLESEVLANVKKIVTGIKESINEHSAEGTCATGNGERRVCDHHECTPNNR